MKKIQVFHLKTGWSDKEFEEKLQRHIDKNMHLEYYDIKISSKDNNCLIIMKEKVE